MSKRVDLEIEKAACLITLSQFSKFDNWKIVDILQHRLCEVESQIKNTDNLSYINSIPNNGSGLF